MGGRNKIRIIQAEDLKKWGNTIVYDVFEELREILPG